MSFPFRKILTMIVLLLLKDAVNVRGSAEQKLVVAAKWAGQCPWKPTFFPSDGTGRDLHNSPLCCFLATFSITIIFLIGIFLCSISLCLNSSAEFCLIPHTPLFLALTFFYSEDPTILYHEMFTFMPIPYMKHFL